MSIVLRFDNAEDVGWLRDVHGIDPFFERGTIRVPYPVFIVYGNEGYPSKIECYTQDHYRSDCTVYEPDENGKMVITKTGKYALKRKRSPRRVEY